MPKPQHDRDMRPVFMVNPAVIIALNDDMAKELVLFLRKMAMETQIPSHVFAFMRQLENDMNYGQQPELED